MLRNTNQSWGTLAKLLHWVMTALIFLQFALGWLAVGWRLSPAKLNLFVWHKSTGMLVLALVTARLLWRWANPVPAPPPGMPQWERAAARATHLLLYLLMIAMPLSGWIINSAARIPLRVFWLIALPDITAPGKALEELAKDVHFGLFVALALALTVHIGAALRHHFAKRDDVLARMLPGAGEAK